MKTTIEACVASVASAIAAEAGGADRLELNVALELDGLTPSMGLYKKVRAACNLPIIVMIRPRSNGFLYSDTEFATMLADIDAFVAAGADGFAIGILTEQFEIDKARTQAAIARMGGRECVFHRAFDITPNMYEALETLIACGVTRVLTSAQAPTAPEGSVELKQLIEQAAGRIEILPGAGIKPNNVAQLVQASGCTQVHGTFKAPAAAQPKVSGLDVLRIPGPAETDAGVVREISKNLHYFLKIR